MATYEEFDALLHAKRGGRVLDTRRLAPHTYAIRHATHLSVRFWQTDILDFWPNGTVDINVPRRWYTMTTKSRLNTFLPHGAWILQQKHVWSLVLDGIMCIPFQERATITPEQVAMLMLREQGHHA